MTGQGPSGAAGAAVLAVAAVLAAALAGAGCNSEVTVRPVIDTPPEERVFADLETIEMSIAVDGDPEPLVSRVFRRGETLELPGVPYGENLVLHMLGRTASSEVAYGRTCRFAVRAGEDTPPPHLYFARTVRWADAPVPPNPVRVGGAALASRNGTALFFGGVDENNATVLGADRFDPSTGKFEELTRLAPRRSGAAASLGDGRAILVGGSDGEDQAVEHIDVITIDAEGAQAVEPFQAKPLSSRAAPALATLSDGRVVAIGGLDAFGTAFPNVHEIASDGGNLLIRSLTDAKLRFPRYGHTLTRLTDDLGAPVLIAGGRDASGAPVPIAELYRPLVERVAPPIEFELPVAVPRWDHAAVRLPDGSIVLVGGRGPSGPIGTIELFTRELGFTIHDFLPLGSGLTDFSITRLPDGRVLLAGGRDASGAAVDTALILRIDTFGGGVDVVNTDRLSMARAGHQATLLCDGTVLLVGGTPGPSHAERYNPPSSGRR